MLRDTPEHGRLEPSRPSSSSSALSNAVIVRHWVTVPPSWHADFDLDSTVIPRGEVRAVVTLTAAQLDSDVFGLVLSPMAGVGTARMRTSKRTPRRAPMTGANVRDDPQPVHDIQLEIPRLDRE